MSLEVPHHIVEQAHNGRLSEQDFIACVKQSLPQAWHIVENLALRKKSGEEGLVAHTPRSMEDATRGQLLRMMASDAIRSAVEKHFGLIFAFQNCHATATFWKHEEAAHTQFTSMESQIINQSPDLRDC